MGAISRREALQWTGAGALGLLARRAAAVALPERDRPNAVQPRSQNPAGLADDRQFHGLRVGVASYSLRRFPLAQALSDTRRLGVRYLSLKDSHLPLNSTPEQIAAARDQAARLGITITSCGVIYLNQDDEKKMRAALEYVRALGASVAVIGISRALLPTLNRAVQGFDLRVAIHNHGPGDRLFPSPLEVYDAVQPLDRKIGLCMDIGHTFRMGEDLVADIRKTKDRLYSMHFKDLDSRAVRARGVPVGTGAMPIIAILRELLAIRYSGEVQLEYEVETNDPLPGMAESFGYMRGALQSV